MNVFWRRTVRELAAQLDHIDELVHALVVTLEEMERADREAAVRPPPSCCPRDASEPL